MKNKSRIVIFATLICQLAVLFPFINAKAVVTTICGCEEHTHSFSDGCYWIIGNPACRKEEHQHSSGCYTLHQELVSGMNDPYDTQCRGESDTELTPVLICKQPEHIHTASCAINAELELKCSQTEHTHSNFCYVETEDQETREEWEASLTEVRLGNQRRQSLLSVAESQLDYCARESISLVHPDGTPKLCTRYGCWYGYPYEDWCAMFVSFCIRYAGIDSTVFPIECSCIRWQSALEEKGLYLSNTPEAQVIPKPGDLVFFGDGDSHEVCHVGLVSALLYEDEQSPQRVTGIETIEGNRSSKVEKFRYAISDEMIAGYGRIPEDAKAEKTDPATEARLRILKLTVRKRIR